MHTVSPWSTTVQLDIENSALLLERKILDYSYQFYNTGDSFWIVVITAQTEK